MAQLRHELRHPGARSLADQCEAAILRRVAGDSAAALAVPRSAADLDHATLPRVAALMKQELSRLQRYNPGAADAAQQQMELTVAGNITLGRMREHVVRILGTVISPEQLDVLIGINGTVKPSRKLLRKRQQARLKEEYLLSAGLVNATAGPVKGDAGAREPVGAKQVAVEGDRLAATRGSRSPSSARRHEDLRVHWSDSSPIKIHGQAATAGGPSAVQRSVGYVVGPAFNKRGVLCDGSSAFEGAQSYPYLSPTPNASTTNAGGAVGGSKPLWAAVRRRLSPVLSEEEQRRLELYLARLKVVESQGRFDRGAVRRDLRSHPAYAEVMTLLLEEVRVVV